MRMRPTLTVAATLLATATTVAACGSGSPSSSGSGAARASARTRVVAARSARRTGSRSGSAAPARVPRRPPAPPQVLPVAGASSATGFTAAVRWRGEVAVRVARTVAGVALLAFDQRLIALHLHSGTVDAGATGWRYGPAIAGPELGRLVAAFNGGFKLDTGAGGFFSYGRTGVPLRSGLASVVTYANGRTDIGMWGRDVPARGDRVISVRQNLSLLVDQGRPAASVGCVSCWGATLGGISDPARSALGITAGGWLVWAGGEHLTPAALADALIGARVVRAVELDINPEWVAAYLYRHAGGHSAPAAVPIVPGQPGVPGQFLAPYSRDFFTLTAR